MQHNIVMNYSNNVIYRVIVVFIIYCVTENADQIHLVNNCLPAKKAQIYNV